MVSANIFVLFLKNVKEAVQGVLCSSSVRMALGGIHIFNMNLHD